MKSLFAVVRSLHRDQRGAEGLEKLLIIAAIVLPLLGLLLVFRDKITSLITSAWNDVKSDAETYTPPDL